MEPQDNNYEPLQENSMPDVPMANQDYPNTDQPTDGERQLVDAQYAPTEGDYQPTGDQYQSGASSSTGVDPGTEENYISAPQRPDLSFESPNDAANLANPQVVQPGEPAINEPQPEPQPAYTEPQMMPGQPASMPDMNMGTGQQMPYQPQPEMMQPVGQGANMTEPQPMPQSMPQMMQQPMLQSTKNKRSLIITVIIAIIVLAVAGVVFALAMNGTLFGASSTPAPTPSPAPSILTPNPEVAQDVCEARGGVFAPMDLSESSLSEAIEAYNCTYGLDANNPESFEFMFLVFGRHFTEIESISLDGLPESATIIENSDELIKVHSTPNVHEFQVAYDNTYIDLYASDADVAEEILSDLGYPNTTTPSE